MIYNIQFLLPFFVLVQHASALDLTRGGSQVPIAADQFEFLVEDYDIPLIPNPLQVIQDSIDNSVLEKDPVDLSKAIVMTEEHQSAPLETGNVGDVNSVGDLSGAPSQFFVQSLEQDDGLEQKISQQLTKENFLQRIVGGRDAAIGEFKCIAYLTNRGGQFCDGSIIHPLHVLTAAHCVDKTSNPDPFAIVVGTNDLSKGGVMYEVSTYAIHQGWSRATFRHDISVLRLKKPIQFNNAVQPINLSTQELADGTTVTLAGWGLTSYPGKAPNALQTIQLLTRNVALSRQDLINAGAGDMARAVWDGQITTGSPKGRGACKGDSGGPLMYGGVQVGIVSWGIPCATGAPDVFTKVLPYRGWIIALVNSKNLMLAN